MNIIEKISSLKWDLLKQEYKNVFSDKQWFPDHPTQNAIGFYDEIENKRVSVVASFLTDNHDKLARINVSFEDIKTDTQRKYIYENLIKDLGKKYGKPIHSTSKPRLNVPPEYCLSESTKWQTNDTVVDISMALSKHGSSNPFLGITFYDRYNDPLMKEFPIKTNDNQKTSEKNLTKNLNKKLDELQFCVTIYTYIFTYAFLRMIEISKTESFTIDDLKVLDDELEKMYGRLSSEWPEDIRNHYLGKLWFILPQEKLFKFFRETIYYLIFIFSSHAHKYLKPSEYKLMLDRLFEIFETTKVPWLNNPPEKDAFNKYNDAKNPILKYHSEISEIEDDILILMDYQNLIIGTFKYIITPLIDKVFENEK